MSNTDVQKIKERLDIVELVEEYVPLKQFGTNWKGLCPFHSEKSPSFMVSRDKQIWHCFGCDRGGDAFGFIQEMDGTEFPEALRVLAKRAGVELTKNYTPKNASKKQLLLDIVASAQSYYTTILTTHPTAEKVRAYITQRGIRQETSTQFALGYSLDGWDGLYTHLKNQQFKDADMADAGLIIKRTNGQGYYDRFRDRLMIPLHDYNGIVVGFTARTLDPEAPGGKYINSPQSMIYDKSRLLYGLYFSKNYIKRLKATIVVEGNIDIITAHQSGFPNIVATSGTAFTDEQIMLLKRYSSNLLLAFDMDGAGIQAAQRSIATALKHSMNIKVIQLPGQYKDPDECIKNDPQAFKQSIRGALSIIDFYFQAVTAPLDLNRVEHKKQAVNALLPVVNMVKDPIERSHYVQRLSDVVHISLDTIKQQLAALPATATTQPKVAAPLVTKVQQAPVQQAFSAPSRYIQLSQFVVGCVFAFPDQVAYMMEAVEVEYITDQAMKELYKQVQSYYNKARKFDVTEFRTMYPQLVGQIDTLELFVQSQLGAENAALSGADVAKSGRTQLIKSVQQLHKFFIQQRLQQIEFELKEAEQHNMQDQVNTLLQELKMITEQLRDLSS